MIINKTRVDQLFKLTNPGSFYVGISVPDKGFRLSLSYSPILGTLARLSPGDLRVPSQFSPLTYLIAHTQEQPRRSRFPLAATTGQVLRKQGVTFPYCAACPTFHAVFHPGILPRIGIVSYSIFSCIGGI